MDILLRYEGVDITNHVLFYNRNTQLCSGIGIIEVRIAKSHTASKNPGDTITLWENGIKVGTYQVGDVSYNLQGEYIVGAQDRSKRLKDYFIDDIIPAQGLTTKYWMEWVFSQAKVTYNFTTAESGFQLSPNDSFGAESAYEAILRFCQQNNWYFYFDADGTCQIGSLATRWSNPDLYLKESDGRILLERRDENDRMLRNRAIIWGGSGVYVTVDRYVPWQRNNNDKRSVVLGNSYIRDYDTASKMAKKLLNEFASILSVKTYEISGPLDVNVGDTVKCKTSIYNGAGIVTTLNVSMDKGGFVTTLTLDERCPRIFSYWSLGPDEYVYAGTDGGGVYRKPISGTTWSSYNTGLSNQNIADLKVKNGLLAVTTDTKEVFYRLVEDTAWTDFTPDDNFEIIDEEGISTFLDTTDFVSRGCDINENTGEIYVGYYSPSTGLSWIMQRNEVSVSFIPVIVGGDSDLELLDVGHDGTNLVATAYGIGDSILKLLWESQDAQVNEQGNHIFAWSQSTVGGIYDPALVAVGSTYTSSNATLQQTLFNVKENHRGYIKDSIFYIILSTGLWSYNLIENSVTYHSFGLTITDFGKWHVYTEDHNVFYIVTNNKLRTYTISTDTLSTIEDPIAASGFSDVSFFGKYMYYHQGYDSGTQTYTIFRYDLTTQSTISKSTLGLLSQDTDSISYFRGVELVAMDDMGVLVATTNNGRPSDTNIARFFYAGINSNGSDFQGTTIMFEFDYGSNQGNNATAILRSDNRNGQAALFWQASIVPGTGHRQYAGGFFFIPSFLSVTKADVYWWYLDTWVSTPWITRVETSAGAGTYTSKGTTFVARRGAFYMLMQEGAYGNSLTWYLKSITGDTVVTDVSAYCTANYQQQLWPLADDQDNTFGVTDTGITATYTVKYIDENDNLKRTYTLDSPIAENYTQKVSLATGHLFAATSNAIKIYTTSGNLVPPGQPSIIAITDKEDELITTSGDTLYSVGIITTSGNALVENSQATPSVFYGIDASESGIVATSFTLISGSLNLPAMTISSNTLGEILDARSLDILGPTIDAYGATVGTDFEQYNYVFVAASGGLFFKNSSIDELDTDWSVYTIASGISRIESTNYTGLYRPHLFYSLSGTPSQFFQKGPGDLTFMEYSTGLPSNNITVIRTEDRL